MHACMLSARLFATQWTRALLCSWNSPGTTTISKILYIFRYICFFRWFKGPLSGPDLSPSLQSDRQTSGRCPTVTPTSEALVNWLSETLFMDLSFMHWRRKWQATPVLFPGESQGRGRLAGRRLWGCTWSDTTEGLSSSGSSRWPSREEPT